MIPLLTADWLFQHAALRLLKDRAGLLQPVAHFCDNIVGTKVIAKKHEPSGIQTGCK